MKRSPERKGGTLGKGCPSWECTPHFLFVLPKRKRAVHGPKEKTLRTEPCAECAGSGRNGALWESVRRASAAPSSLRLPHSLQELRLRIR